MPSSSIGESGRHPGSIPGVRGGADDTFFPNGFVSGRCSLQHHDFMVVHPIDLELEKLLRRSAGIVLSAFSNRTDRLNDTGACTLMRSGPKPMSALAYPRFVSRGFAVEMLKL